MARSPLVDRPDLEVAPAVTDSGDGDTAARAEAGLRFKAMELHLKKQPKVRIRLPEAAVVTINGYSFQIPGKQTVEVPQSVAEIIEGAQEGGRF